MKRLDWKLFGKRSSQHRQELLSDIRLLGGVWTTVDISQETEDAIRKGMRLQPDEIIQAGVQYGPDQWWYEIVKKELL